MKTLFIILVAALIVLGFSVAGIAGAQSAATGSVTIARLS